MKDKKPTHYAIPIELGEELHKFLMGLPYEKVSQIIEKFRKGQVINITPTDTEESVNDKLAP